MFFPKNHWTLIFQPILINLVPKYCENLIFFEKKKIIKKKIRGSNPLFFQKKTEFSDFWSFLTPKLNQNQVITLFNIFFIIFLYLSLLLWVFWHQLFENRTKIELIVFYSVKYSKYSWLVIMKSKNEGCQLVLFFQFSIFFFFILKVHDISFPKMYTSQNLHFHHIGVPPTTLKHEQLIFW